MPVLVIRPGDQQPGASGGYDRLERRAQQVTEARLLGRVRARADDVSYRPGDDVHGDHANVEDHPGAQQQPGWPDDGQDRPQHLQPGDHQHEHAVQPVLLEVRTSHREMNHGRGQAHHGQAVGDDLATRDVGPRHGQPSPRPGIRGIGREDQPMVKCA